MKSKPTIASKFVRVIAAVLVMSHIFTTLAMPTSAKAAGVPGLVSSFVAPASASHIALSWQAPSDDGGSPITGYLARIRLTGDSLWSSVVMQPDQLSITFDGLTVGGHYDVAVAATNAIGTGQDSEILNITVGSVPGIVENLSFVDTGDSVMRATWSPPAEGGSTPITSYDFAYSLTGAENWDEYNVASGSAMIVGLTSDLYDIRVRANNSIGSGEWTYLRYQYLGDVNYNISTCQELQAIRYVPDAIYNLMNDIDCTDVNFTPIGTTDHPFIGTLDGHNYSINNLTINAATDYAGLFGAVGASTIQNLTINGAVAGGDYTGGLIGRAFDIATISNVTSNVAVMGNNYTGGLIGYSAGLDADFLDVSNSSASGQVNGASAVGGLIGYSTATAIVRSHASGAVTSSEDYAGGLIGRSIGNTISQSYATGTVISQATRAGGLVGESVSDTISDSYARGDTSTPNIYYAGGLVGAMNSSSLTRVYSTGVVNGYGIIGGLVGYNASGSTITDSFSASYVLPDGNGWDARANNGLVGIDYGNEITYHNVFFNSINNANDCTRDNNFAIVTSEDCTGINLQFNETMFKQAGDSPINTWDLGGIWHLNTNDFPTLSPITNPYILCEQPGSTDNTVSVHCTSAPDGWGATTWQMQYKKTSASTWNDVTLADPSVAQATISSLIPGTQYQVRFRFTNDWGTSEWGRQDILTTGTAPAQSQNEPISSTTRAITTTAVTEQITAESSKIYLNDFSEYTASTGKILELKLGQIVYFYVRGELHSATVTEIGPDYVILRVASEPQDVRISLGQAKEVSVLQNGTKDISIKLISVQDDKVTLSFAAINATPAPSRTKQSIPSPWLLLLAVPLGYVLAIRKRRYE